MPIVDVPQLPLTTMTGEVRPPWESPDVAPAPVTENAPSLLGAALRQGNSAVSALSSRTLFADNSVDPHFDVKGMLDGLIGTKYEGDRERFLDANNAAYATQLKQQIDTEQADKATLEASPWMGFAANIGAMATDPLMYIPFVGEAAKGVEVVLPQGKSCKSFTGITVPSGARLVGQAFNSEDPTLFSKTSRFTKCLLHAVHLSRPCCPLPRSSNREAQHSIIQVLSKK